MFTQMNYKILNIISKKNANAESLIAQVLAHRNIVKTPTQCQLNNNSTKVGYTKMTLQTTTHHPPQKLNVYNISAVTDPILTRL